MSTLTPTRPTRLPSRMLHPAQKQVSVGILSTYPPPHAVSPPSPRPS